MPKLIISPSRSPKSEDFRDWDLSPTKPDWSRGLADTWRPGESGAQARLQDFKKNLATYAEDRNRLDKAGTSRLSPHLAFGEISPAGCWRAATDAAKGKGGHDQSIETFIRELVWREFSHSLLFHFPKLPEEPLRRDFAAFPWRRDPEQLKAWQRGKTGYPIVDAGMRELWATGYMHNRARMITASFLIKHLLIPWTAGEAWFCECSSTRTLRTILRAGSGSRVAARMQRRISAFLIPYCRARNSIRMVIMYAGGFPNSRTYRQTQFTTRGRRVPSIWRRRGLCLESHTLCQSWITNKRAQELCKPMSK